MVHVKKDETPEKQFSKGIYDYWPNYEARRTGKSINPNSLIEYFRMGRFEFEKNNELCAQIEWIAKGIRRLINKAKGQNLIAATNNPFLSIIKQFPEEKQLEILKDFYVLSSADISKEEEWQSVVRILKDILKELDLTINQKVKKFLALTNKNYINCICFTGL